MTKTFPSFKFPLLPHSAHPKAPNPPQKFHKFSYNFAQTTKKGASLGLLLNCTYCLLFLSLESILAESANGALEVLGNLFPRRAGSNSLAGLSNFWVVFISTGANVFHSNHQYFSLFILFTISTSLYTSSLAFEMLCTSPIIH